MSAASSPPARFAAARFGAMRFGGTRQAPSTSSSRPPGRPAKVKWFPRLSRRVPRR